MIEEYKPEFTFPASLRSPVGNLEMMVQDRSHSPNGLTTDPIVRLLFLRLA